MIFEDGLRFTEQHLWVKKFGLTDYAERAMAGREVYVGITALFKNKLTEDRMWYVRVGKKISRGQSAGIIYSQNMHMDIIMPLSGTILQANMDFLKPPFWSNTITEKNWIMIIDIDRPGEWNELLVPAEYEKHFNGLSVK